MISQIVLNRINTVIDGLVSTGEHIIILSPQTESDLLNTLNVQFNDHPKYSEINNFIGTYRGVIFFRDYTLPVIPADTTSPAQFTFIVLSTYTIPSGYE